MTQQDQQPVEQRFLATVSHEIRTPLNGILGMASLLAETELTPAQSDYVSAIRQSGARLLDLLNNVLDYARMDAAGVELELTRVDLKRLAQEVVELLSPRAHAKGLDVSVRCSQSFPNTVLLDDGRVRQILFNLVGNAIKFTDTGGVLVDLSVSQSDKLQIDIIDSGPGLSDEAQSRLFSAFEQAESRHRGIDGGVGLGLTIVKRLIDAMNGDIELTSAPGIGARFRISLDINGAEIVDASDAQTTSDPMRIGLAGLSPPLILSLSSMAEQAGHIPVVSGCEQSVDVWLADASMPPREINRLSGLAPVIAMIRPEDREHVPNLRSNGCSGYLMRPVRSSSLFEQIRKSVETEASVDTEDLTDTDTAFRILVADDNAVNSMIATRTLEKAGYSCTTTATGAEALEAVELTDFACILMDLRMPVMDGFEAMRQIRELPEEKSRVPIIAISAEINPDVEKAARAAGADAVAAKPLDAHTLRSIVERWTDRRKSSHEYASS